MHVAFLYFFLGDNKKVIRYVVFFMVEQNYREFLKMQIMFSIFFCLVSLLVCFYLFCLNQITD